MWRLGGTGACLGAVVVLVLTIACSDAGGPIVTAREAHPSSREGFTTYCVRYVVEGVVDEMCAEESSSGGGIFTAPFSRECYDLATVDQALPEGCSAAP
jgi:hypothetical protein